MTDGSIPVMCHATMRARALTPREAARARVGMQHVVVNGTPVQVDGERVVLAGLPGRVVRPAPRAAAGG
jgi:hypothetical protein